MNIGIRAVVAVTIALVSVPIGCASKPKAPTLAELEAAELPYINEIIADQKRVQERILARCEREYQEALAAGNPNDRALDMLVLSGGGAKGAFGAGFLVGWGEVRDPAHARPSFDIVTGVSTGNLIAPMAFCGDAESYRVANEMYRNPAADWVKPRSLLDVIITERSFYTNEGLFKAIRTTIGPRVPAIAAGCRDDRTLLIAAVNLNQGLTRAWDLTALACDVESGAITSEDFCRRNLASASIPLVFPPQLIDDNLYVDGSTTSDILVSLEALDSASALPEAWKARHPNVPFPKVRMWVIANTALFVEPVTVDAKDLAVLARALDLSVQAALLAELKIVQVYHELLAARGIDVEFRFVSLPDGWTQKGEGMFNKDDMVAMSDLGMKMGRDPASWRTQVPSLLVPVQLRDHLLRAERRSASGH